jgi:hypothetical protein
MSTQFENAAPPETAWRRNVRLVVEVLDAVTGEPIRNGLEVRVTGLTRAATMSFGGAFVWRAESGATPTRVDVDPGHLPYLPRSAAVPAPSAPPGRPQYSLLRIELAPKPAYPFDTGATGVRGTLIRDSTEDPGVPIELTPPAENIRLQWMDDNSHAPPGWTDAAVVSSTDAAGDFAAIVRLGPKQIASTDSQGRMRVRVAVTRAGATKFSPELQIRPGYVTDVSQSFAWDQFTNV